jgi:hypothetical protein
MDLPRVKYSGGKIFCHSDLQAGTSLGATRQKDNCNKVSVLHWNTGDLNQAKKAEFHKTLDDEESVVFYILEASVREENEKYLHLKNYDLNFLP